VLLDEFIDVEVQGNPTYLYPSLCAALDTRPPTDDFRLNLLPRLHGMPSALGPVAEVGNRVGAAVILAQQLQWLPASWGAFIGELGEPVVARSHLGC
jgi:hypothetical protein